VSRSWTRPSHHQSTKNAWQGHAREPYPSTSRRGGGRSRRIESSGERKRNPLLHFPASAHLSSRVSFGQSFGGGLKKRWEGVAMWRIFGTSGGFLESRWPFAGDHPCSPLGRGGLPVEHCEEL